MQVLEIIFCNHNKRKRKEKIFKAPKIGDFASKFVYLRSFIFKGYFQINNIAKTLNIETT